MPPLRAPRANLRVPRLKLARPRPEGSVALDNTRTNGRRNLQEDLEIPPFVTWGQFLAGLDLQQGQHITIVGSTGSGKTTLAMRLLPYRNYCVVLATKNRDESLYPRLEKEGFEFVTDPALDAEQTPKVIFRPKLEAPTADAQNEQRELFAEVLTEIFNDGNWAVYGDEIRYLSDNLKLRQPLELLWLQGRSLGITMIVSTQRPVSIPVVAFESAEHLFLFRTTDQANIDRAAEFESANKPLLRYLLPVLERYEVLYINARTGNMLRTMVRL